MTPSRRRSTARSDAGNALVELALALPLLVVIIAGTVDFARVFNVSISLTNAARAGAQYGAFSLPSSGDFTAISTVAVNSVPDLTGVTTSIARYCSCATDVGAFSSTTPANTCTGTCAVGHMVVLVTVTAQKTFTTILHILPGVPSSINLSRAATMRVDN